MLKVRHKCMHKKRRSAGKGAGTHSCRRAVTREITGAAKSEIIREGTSAECRHK